MTDELRARLRAELNAQRPPPLGDLVPAAMRAGRRTRRHRRWAAFGAAVAFTGAVGTAGMVVGELSRTAGPDPVVPVAADPPGVPPGFVPPPPPAAPTATPTARTLTVQSGTSRADGARMKATSGAMLHLLTRLLPPGRTSHYAVASDDDLDVRLYLDDGAGPGMIRVRLSRTPPVDGKAPRGSTATVTIRHLPDDCLRDTVVDARWTDGTAVQVDVATCLTAAGPRGGPAISADEAVRVAADPRWGLMMSAELVGLGAKEFATLPEFRR